MDERRISGVQLALDLAASHKTPRKAVVPSISLYYPQQMANISSSNVAVLFADITFMFP